MSVMSDHERTMSDENAERIAHQLIAELGPEDRGWSDPSIDWPLFALVSLTTFALLIAVFWLRM